MYKNEITDQKEIFCLCQRESKNKYTTRSNPKLILNDHDKSGLAVSWD